MPYVHGVPELMTKHTKRLNVLWSIVPPVRVDVMGVKIGVLPAGFAILFDVFSGVIQVRISRTSTLDPRVGA